MKVGDRIRAIKDFPPNIKLGDLGTIFDISIGPKQNAYAVEYDSKALMVYTDKGFGLLVELINVTEKKHTSPIPLVLRDWAKQVQSYVSK